MVVVGAAFLATTHLLAAGLPQKNHWRTVTPEEVGFDSEGLVQLFDYVRERKIPVHSIQIVRHGGLVLDAYFYPFRSGLRHDVASVTKSITSTLVGLAIRDGYLLDVQQPIVSAFPGQKSRGSDKRMGAMTVEHLLTMSAGWDCGFEPNEARLFEMRRSPDWLQFMLDLPMVAEPGSRWAYCSGNCHVLSMLLGRKIGTNALAFAQEKLFGPLEIRDAAWSADPDGNPHGWGDLQLHPLDMAKIGQLMLQHGAWNGRQLIPETWVAAATKAHINRTSNEDHYGYFWWVKGTNFPGLFEAVGRGGQRIIVWPSKSLVLVFTGGGFEPRDLAPFILKALKSEKALSPNRQGHAQLKNKIDAATLAPSPRSIPKLATTAARISGRTFHLEKNSSNWKTLRFRFSTPLAAEAELSWDGTLLTIPIGLNGVPRFSTNSLNGLLQAAEGEWLSEQAFLLQLDLLGGVNFYQVKFEFAHDGTRLVVHSNERTGLHQERFTGSVRD